MGNGGSDCLPACRVAWDSPGAGFQIPRLASRRRDELERLLASFDQGLVKGNGRGDAHVLMIAEEDYPEERAFVLQQLREAMAEEEVRRNMEGEGAASPLRHNAVPVKIAPGQLVTRRGRASSSQGRPRLLECVSAAAANGKAARQFRAFQAGQLWNNHGVQVLSGGCQAGASVS